ncbi:hypothetical protein M409DRAFT_52381 [Zasmidium cellare ATCC 36951]|uniref:Uncharacterized protein n=1 Tax=Zasmidium cellare ATCC 36951 TaxID=1080233 RepID=A0A6A6CUN8_ZASCE|nr:uncharacterized protein M409DRAFT_52381 [Zasmidium cellare ATCC 36951]KAF2169900.1 hypothetical protein M409DRAFT_52381 [Zasmidium cellare ATCC 36951]
MASTIDPDIIGTTYYPDNASKSKSYHKRWRPDGRDAVESDDRGRDYSPRARKSNDSLVSARRDRSRSRPRQSRRSSSNWRPHREDRSRPSSLRRRSLSPRDNDYKGKPEKPWFKKKTFWTTIASIASVASVAAVSLSTQATRESAQATKRSAKATTYAAEASHRSADASNRIAAGNDLSTRAVVNTAVANGHQDHQGRYLGPISSEGGRIPRARRLSWERIANGPERRRSRDRTSHRRRSSQAHYNHTPHGPGLLECAPLGRV